MDDENRPQAGDTSNTSPSTKSVPPSKKSEGEDTPDIHEPK